MAIHFAFNIKGDEGTWNPGTVYYYNGDTNEIQGFHNPEEYKWFRETFQQVYGYPLKRYDWTSKAPVYVRVFSVLKPTHNINSSELANTLNDLRKKVQEYLEMYADPDWFQPLMGLPIRSEPSISAEEIGVAQINNIYEVIDMVTACNYEWAKINFKGRIGYIPMSDVTGDEFGIRGRRAPLVSRNEFIKYVRSLVNTSQDTDGVRGAQSIDLITHVQKRFWNFWGQGNAIDFVHNAMPSGWKRGSVASMGVKPGDILVWKWSESDNYGHIGICVDGNATMQTSVEQNVDNLSGGSPAKLQTRALTNCIAVLRPNFAPEPTSPRPIPNTGKPKTIAKRGTAPAKSRTYRENGTATVKVNAINVRRSPDTKSHVVAVYRYGQSVRYDTVVLDQNGYVWISYIGGSGKRNYMATGATRNGTRYGAAWCTFR